MIVDTAQPTLELVVRAPTSSVHHQEWASPIPTCRPGKVVSLEGMRPKGNEGIMSNSMTRRDPQSGRIDHPPNFSKDCADAVAGVVYGLTYRRATWVRFGVPITPGLVEAVRAIENGDRKSEAARRATGGGHLVPLAE